MEPAIQIQELAKQYKKGRATGSYLTLREVVGNFFTKQAMPNQSRSFWALKDISFTVSPGERLGIIGHNGAGKSTLLKIISRITPPTKGRVVLNGRVASLLEVGTGFHPELTGRENIYLNGSILGLKRTEINERINEIVEFSGVADFINTPIKHYSSGMQLRLAFSVAAHLEPEILLIDEVLAVGDIEFQKRSLGKMEEVSQRGGRTILFVSHNLDAVTRLCNKALWLRAGREVMAGNVPEVVSAYANDVTEAGYAYYGENVASLSVCIIKGWIETNGSVPNAVQPQQPLTVKMRVAVNRQQRFSFEVLVRDSMRQPLLFLPTGLVLGSEHNLPVGEYEASITLPLPFLACDRYFLDLIVAETNKGYIHYLESALRIEVEGKVFDETNFQYTAQQRMGKVLLTGGNMEIQQI